MIATLMTTTPLTMTLAVPVLSQCGSRNEGRGAVRGQGNGGQDLSMQQQGYWWNGLIRRPMLRFFLMELMEENTLLTAVGHRRRRLWNGF